MLIQQWQSDTPGWRVVDNGSSVVNNGGAPPVLAGSSSKPLGLQVTLLLKGQESGMVKVFLLGAAQKK